jgi:hypothetical protein
MNGWIWATLCFFSPVVFGVAYLLARHAAARSSSTDLPPTDQPYSTSVYSLYKWWPIQITGTISIFAAIGVLLVVMSATGRNGPGWIFTGCWLAAFCLAAWMFLWRVVYQLQLHDNVLTWKAPLRSGSVCLPDIQAIHPWNWGVNVEAIDLADGQTLLVMVQKGFRSFIGDVAKMAPAIPIRLGRFSSLADRWPRIGNGYSRHK